jgi:LysM repeat protein
MRHTRPLEEVWLFILMGLLICAALLSGGIIILLAWADSQALAEVVDDTPTPPLTTIPPQTIRAPQWPSPTPIIPAATPHPQATPTRTPVPTPTKLSGTYRVQSGDTLLGIAYRAGVTLDQILLVNLTIKDPNKLALGQIINIPAEGQVPVGPPPTPVPAVIAPPVRVSGNLVYPQLGSPGGYVPLGAMSVSAEHYVGRKHYPAGTFEYLHGQIKIPFPLPYIDKGVIKLPPPVPAGVCPLTGLPLANASVLNRRPLNVRVDNSPPARPQSGLSSADLIFETLAEGGITRFTAVFLCESRDVDLGPIRSARLIDLQLTPMFKAILVHAGASVVVTDMIWSSEIGEADFDPILRGVPGFGRIASRPSPHNLYTSLGELWSVANQRRLNGPVDLQGLSFSNDMPTGGRPARTLRVPYGIASDVAYTYNTNTGRYTKWIGGEPHSDANTGQALTFANIIVLFAKATYTDVLEDNVASRSLHFMVQGQGRALLLRDGQVYEAVWNREGRNILFHYTDANGNHIPLKPGTTIVNIAPLELRVTTE